MSDERRPLWPWIAALLIGLPVLYVLSFGPACWVASRNRAALLSLNSVYLPIGWTLEHGPQVVSNSLEFYVRMGMPPHSAILLQYGPFPLGYLVTSPSPPDLPVRAR
jgi:hypothetical protein